MHCRTWPPNPPPIPPPNHANTPKGAKNRHIQETGLPGTKWITGTYSHLYRTKIVPSINTSIYHATHLTKINTKITRHIKPRLHLDLTKIKTKINTKITRHISPRLIPRSRGIIESRLIPRLIPIYEQD